MLGQTGWLDLDTISITATDAHEWWATNEGRFLPGQQNCYGQEGKSWLGKIGKEEDIAKGDCESPHDIKAITESHHHFDTPAFILCRQHNHIAYPTIHDPPHLTLTDMSPSSAIGR